MSGMYNMLMGHNPVLGHLAHIIGINRENIRSLGRLRDAWISEDAKTIGVLHRNYGEDGAAANEAARQLPTFREQRPTSDETYQEWLFDVPEGAQEAAKALAAASDTTPCFQRYLEAIEALKRGDDNPQTQHMKKVGEQIVTGLTKTLSGQGSQSVETPDGGVDIVDLNGDSNG